MTRMDLLANVHSGLPWPSVRYIAVNVVSPGVSPLSTELAEARCTDCPARTTAFASEAANVFAPVAANDTRHEVEFALPIIALVTDTSTLPEVGTLTVAEGPGVVRGT